MMILATIRRTGLSLMALGIGDGDEVITTSLTAFPTITGILRSGAKPVLVDVLLKDGLINPDLIEQKINKIDLLKVDVQGAESLVFEGSHNTLKRTKVVIVEICFFDYYENKGGFFDIEKFLKPKGFSLFTISEISYNPMNGRTDWVEVIYKKDI